MSIEHLAEEIKRVHNQQAVMWKSKVADLQKEREKMRKGWQAEQAENKTLKEALGQINKRAYLAHSDPKSNEHSELYGIAGDAAQALE